MKVSVCISKAFKNLFEPEILKAVFLASLPVFAFYVGILIFFWNHIIAFSYHLISWVPFSVLKLNGAFFVMFFLWFISVVVSFAIITAVFSPLFLKNLNERFHYLYTVFGIVFFSLLYAVLFIKNWDFLYVEIQKLLVLLPFDTVSKGVGAIVAGYIFYNLFILTLFMLMFLISKPLLDAIKEEEYPEIKIPIKEKFPFKRIFFKDIAIFIGLFVILFPLLFIPIVNIGVQLFLWTKLYHDSFIYFLCNEYCSKEVFNQIKQHQFKTIILAVMAASFNFLPIINFFAPFFALIMFFHCIIQIISSSYSPSEASHRM